MRYPTFDFDKDKCLKFSETLKVKSIKRKYFGALKSEYIFRHGKPDNIRNIFGHDFIKWCEDKIKAYKSDGGIQLSANQADLMSIFLDDGKKWLRSSIRRWVEKVDFAEYEKKIILIVLKAYREYIWQEFSTLSKKRDRDIRKWGKKNSDKILTVLGHLYSSETALKFMGLYRAENLISENVGKPNKAIPGRPGKDWKKILCYNLVSYFHSQKRITIEKSAFNVIELFEELNNDHTVEDLPEEIRDKIKLFLERLQLSWEKVTQIYYKTRKVTSSE